MTPASQPAAAPAALDPAQRQTASALAQHNPRWAVMWGLHSRLYWAFPLFDVPRHTVVSAADPGTLLAGMRQTEMTAALPLPR